MIKRKIIILLAVLFLSSTYSFGSTTGFTTTSTYSGIGLSVPSDRVYGWSFGTNVSLNVTDLGYFDSTFDDGLKYSHEVGVWDSNGTLLGSVTVPAGDSATLEGAFRFVTLDSPISLDAGQVYIIGASIRGSGDDKSLRKYDAENLEFSPTITFVEGRVHSRATGLDYPVLSVTNDIGIRLDANFKADIVPEFDADSASITNPYCPLKVNDLTTFSGQGDWSGQSLYMHCAGTEIVDGVNCLKVNMISTRKDEYNTLWAAQDTGGNVWIVKVYNHASNQAFYLGEDFESWFMPANPAVGAWAGITLPEDSLHFCEIVQMGESIGSWDNCLEVNCYNHGGVTEVEYYAQDIGLVAVSTAQDPNSRLEATEVFKSVSPADLNNDGDVDGDDLSVFSEDYGLQ